MKVKKKVYYTRGYEDLQINYYIQKREKTIKKTKIYNIYVCLLKIVNLMILIIKLLQYYFALYWNVFRLVLE